MTRAQSQPRLFDDEPARRGRISYTALKRTLESPESPEDRREGNEMADVRQHRENLREIGELGQRIAALADEGATSDETVESVGVEALAILEEMRRLMKDR